MAEIPLAWLVTALTGIAAAAVLRSVRFPSAARIFLGVGLLALALVGFLLGLRVAYDVDWAGVVQPLVAMLVFPSIYLGLAAFCVDDPYPWKRTMLWHAGPLVVAAIAIVASRLWLADIVLPLLALAYAVLLIPLVRKPAEAFLHVTPRDYRHVRAAIVTAIAFFLMSFIGDLGVFLSVLLQGPGAINGLVSGTSTVLTLLVFLVALIGIPWILSRQEVETQGESRPKPAQASPEDTALVARLDAMLEETRLFTDTNLTLARAARRLGVPARALSGAVNRVTGQNVSRHINGFRIAAAQRLLRDTDLPVTEIMLEIGFLSKSAFNTEFRRITGETPTGWRQAQT